MLVMIAIACHEPSGSGRPDGEPPPTTTAQPPTTTPDALAPVAAWSVGEDGLDLRLVHRVGDVDGDGFGDFAVDVQGRWTTHGTWIVTGDPRRDLVLPDDAYARVLDQAQVGDVDGDGVPDLYLWESGRVVLGPFAGEIDPERDGSIAPEHAFLQDADGDGRFDLVRSDLAELGEDVWTDWTRWADEPTLRVRPPCEPPSFWYGVEWVGLKRFDDLDGDGRGEVWVGGLESAYGWEFCSRMWFPEGPTGVYDPSLDPKARLHIPPFEPAGDQDGDGIQDVVLLETREVLAGPVTFDHGEVRGALLWRAATSTDALPFDVDRDGIGDFLSRGEAGAVLTGGAYGGIVTGQPWARVGSPSESFTGAFYAGRGIVLARGSTRIEVYDLGDAYPIALHP